MQTVELFDSRMRYTASFSGNKSNVYLLSIIRKHLGRARGTPLSRDTFFCWLCIESLQLLALNLLLTRYRVSLWIKVSGLTLRAL